MSTEDGGQASVTAMMLPGIRSAPAPRGWFYRLLVGAVAALLATLARAAIDPLLHGVAPYVTYYLAILVAGWVGGALSGALALALGGIAGNYLFIAPRFELSLRPAPAVGSALVFVLFGATLIAIARYWRREEAALLRAQAVLAQAGQMAHLGAWAVEYRSLENVNANPLYWSDETFRIFGLEPRSVPASNDLFFSLVHPDDRARVAEAVAAAMAARRPYSLEHRITRPDGTERIVYEHAEFEFDAEGRPCWMVGAVQDLTDQRRIERSVRESSDRLRRIVEHIHDALIIDDVKGRLVFANDRFLQLFGFDRTELDRLSIEDYVAPEYRAALRECHDRRMRGEDVPTQFEYEGIARDGRRMWIEVDVVPVLDDRGEIVGTQSALRDVTDRKRADEILRASEETARRRAEELEKLQDELRGKAEELEEASRLKDDFIATVSHELRTPLNAILGWAELLREGRLGTGAAQVRAFTAIADNARRQAQLIEDLLDMSRVVAGKLRLDPRPIDPATPIQAAIEAVLPSAEAKGVQVRAYAPRGVGVVFADAARIQQVAWNLLTNAVKFTPPGGTVRVEVRARSGQLEIAVRDTGVGIPPAFLPFVFDRFRQADSRAARSHGGLGIGLSIVRHLVEAHGGRVHAESDGEGKGATFVVALPLWDAAADDRRRDEPVAFRKGGTAGSPALPPDLCGVRVLAVDDEPDARELTSLALAHYGAKVTTAASADEALQLLDDASVDVLVVDIAMPEVDGYALLQMIREKVGAAALPAVAVTAFAREEDRRRALDSGFAAHLPKPVDELALARTIARLAARDAA